MLLGLASYEVIKLLKLVLETRAALLVGARENAQRASGRKVVRLVQFASWALKYYTPIDN